MLGRFGTDFLAGHLYKARLRFWNTNSSFDSSSLYEVRPSESITRSGVLNFTWTTLSIVIAGRGTALLVPAGRSCRSGNSVDCWQPQPASCCLVPSKLVRSTVILHPGFSWTVTHISCEVQNQPSERAQEPQLTTWHTIRSWSRFLPWGKREGHMQWL